MFSRSNVQADCVRRLCAVAGACFLGGYFSTAKVVTVAVADLDQDITASIGNWKRISPEEPIHADLLKVGTLINARCQAES